jgi:hypothetical protein
MAKARGLIQLLSLGIFTVLTDISQGLLGILKMIYLHSWFRHLRKFYAEIVMKNCLRAVLRPHLF